MAHPMLADMDEMSGVMNDPDMMAASRPGFRRRARRDNAHSQRDAGHENAQTLGYNATQTHRTAPRSANNAEFDPLSRSVAE